MQHLSVSLFLCSFYVQAVQFEWIKQFRSFSSEVWKLDSFGQHTTSKTSTPILVSNLNQNTALTCFHRFTCCCSSVQTCSCHVFIYLFTFILHLLRMCVFNRTHQIYLCIFYIHKKIELFGCIKKTALVTVL